MAYIHDDCGGFLDWVEEGWLVCLACGADVIVGRADSKRHSSAGPVGPHPNLDRIDGHGAWWIRQSRKRRGAGASATKRRPIRG